MDHLKKYITEINDYPKKGIVFKDLNPIYKEPKIWKELMFPLQNLISTKKPDYIAGIESRGFISASALAFKLEIGLITIRKPNKLPGEVIGTNYKLEYGEDRLEIQQNIIEKDSKILLFDDLLATGGTALAAAKLIAEQGGEVIGFSFLIELEFLRGREKLQKVSSDINSIIKY